MKDYFELINLKNIFLKKIDKLDIQFQQYGGTNFNDEIGKYKRYNDNLEIINNQIYLLLTIKYIEYLIEFIKSLHGEGIEVNDINRIKEKISKLSLPSRECIRLRSIIVDFISNKSIDKKTYKDTIKSDKYNILSGLDEQKIKNITGQNNITSLENELQIYSQHNSQLSDIITNNKIKIENLINGNSEKNEIIVGNIEIKFIFLLDIIKYILDKILALKNKRIYDGLYTKLNEYNIFNYCNTYRYIEGSLIYIKINEICGLCKSINPTIKVVKQTTQPAWRPTGGPNLKGEVKVKNF